LPRRTLALLVVVIVAGCGAPARPRALVLATTTSVANSGLLDVLLAGFQQQRGLQVRAHLVGSGLALRLLERRDADMAITHAPEAEAAALRDHPGWRYRKIMFNDFVLVGPRADPGGVRGAPSVEAAMRRIANSQARFLSRGDKSGTHEREEQLWQKAGARPAQGRLVAAGSGMGTTLRIASDTGAYTLTDRATLAQHGHTLHLVIVFEGGPLLTNTYAAILDAAAPRANEAQTFFDWVVDGPGRRIIENYRIRDVPAFMPWPEQVPGVDPHALPRSPE
jgi:tungstate transport system substrate-binding protein